MKKAQKPKATVATKVKVKVKATKTAAVKEKANTPVAGETADKEKTKAAGPAASAQAKPNRQNSKQAIIIDMLKAPKGATVADLSEATGWQKHSIQGAMSGALKKKLGLTITSEKDEKRGRVYRIEGGRA